jgi:hypothetical protein
MRGERDDQIMMIYRDEFLVERQKTVKSAQILVA